MPRIVCVTTVPQTLVFFRGQLRYLQSKGFDVYVISSPGSELTKFGQQESVHTYGVRMARKPAPLADVMSLVSLTALFREIRPLIVHAHTPKAGLLAMIAGAICRVPVRLYTIHGLPFMTRKGLTRSLLRYAESTTCHLAKKVYAVSQSIASCAVSESVVSPSKIKVLGHGSINGVDTEGRFNPSRFAEKRDFLRHQLGIPAHARTIGFVGRIVQDKGILELATAWSNLRREYEDVRLILAGDFEEEDPVPTTVRDELLSDPRVHFLGWVDDPAWVFSVIDVLVLPSRREGFGVVAIEAAAMEVPVVACKIPGCVDAVQDGVTGKLVPAEEPQALTEAIKLYLNDATLRKEHGRAGRERARMLFRPETIWKLLYDEYEQLVWQAEQERS